MGPRRSIQYIVILLLVAALGFTSSAAVAYWNELQQTSNVVVHISDEQANLVVTETSENFTGTLVPINQDYLEGQVSEVVFTYTVEIDQTLAREVDLIVNATNITINDSQEYADLVNIDINGSGVTHTDTLFNSVVTITVIVTLEEPIDADEAAARGLDPNVVNVEDSVIAYNDIIGQVISFDINFLVQPKETNNVD